MTIYTIKQKMSGTGTIHDIASDLYNRDIRFPAGHVYAVVLAAYYGGKGYTTHKTAAAPVFPCPFLLLFKTTNTHRRPPMFRV